jgi:hypothetical protein
MIKPVAKANRLLLACLLVTGAGSPALAASSFQNTCSQINFAYSGIAPTLTAICLTVAGTPHPSRLVLQGISNQNGTLTYSGGASTFQRSCGNIQIVVNNASTVTLTALCRTMAGRSNPTSLPLDNISNNNGNLTQ